MMSCCREKVSLGHTTSIARLWPWNVAWFQSHVCTSGPMNPWYNLFGLFWTNDAFTEGKNLFLNVIILHIPKRQLYSLFLWRNISYCPLARLPNCVWVLVAFANNWQIFFNNEISTDFVCYLLCRTNQGIQKRRCETADIRLAICSLCHVVIYRMTDFTFKPTHQGNARQHQRTDLQFLFKCTVMQRAWYHVEHLENSVFNEHSSWLLLFLGTVGNTKGL